MPPKGSGRATNAPLVQKNSKIIILKLSPSSLSRFASDASSKESSLSAKNSPAPELKEESSKPGTPVPTAPERKKPGPPKGTKRKAEAFLSDGTPKPRGKPGPKKRKLDGTDAEGRPWTTPAAGVGAHKLGPKANQGAINAGLRALDRTGRPCRKWTKRSITLKSFTGQIWAMPTWAAPRRQSLTVEEEAASTLPENTSNGNGSDSKENSAADKPDEGTTGGGGGGGGGGSAVTPAPSSDAGRHTPAADPDMNGTKASSSHASTPIPAAA